MLYDGVTACNYCITNDNIKYKVNKHVLNGKWCITNSKLELAARIITIHLSILLVI